MQSKTWCCKLSRPLIRKDITRFWPIWSSYLAIWLMLLPIPLLNSLAESRSGRTDVLCTVYRQIVTAGGNASLVMTLIFGGLSAAAVWSYLFQSRSASLFHALPVTRGTLFVSHFAAGLGFLAVPNVLLAAVTYLCQLSAGCTDPMPILHWLAAVCLESLLFFSIGTLAAMLTGSLPAMPVLYGLLNFAAAACESLWSSLACLLYYGVSNLSARLTFLSPFIRLVAMSPGKYVSYVPAVDAGFSQQLQQFDPDYLRYLVRYGLAALALAAAALLVNPHRNHDRAVLRALRGQSLRPKQAGERGQLHGHFLPGRPAVPRLIQARFQLMLVRGGQKAQLFRNKSAAAHPGVPVLSGQVLQFVPGKASVTGQQHAAASPVRLQNQRAALFRPEIQKCVRQLFLFLKPQNGQAHLLFPPVRSQIVTPVKGCFGHIVGMVAVRLKQHKNQGILIHIQVGQGQRIGCLLHLRRQRKLPLPVKGVSQHIQAVLAAQLQRLRVPDRHREGRLRLCLGRLGRRSHGFRLCRRVLQLRGLPRQQQPDPGTARCKHGCRGNCP